MLEGEAIERGPNEKFAWVYFVFSFAFTLALGQGWPSGFTYAFGSLTLGSFIYLCTIPQVNKPTKTFACPLVPLIPCLGILGNFILVAEADLITWVYFGIYEAMGALFYFFYGLKHSRLNKRFQVRENEASMLVNSRIQ